MVKRYGGTRLGRQELDGELIEDRADALWTRAMIEACRVTQAPVCQRIVVAVDPPASAGAQSASCGLVAAGVVGDTRLCARRRDRVGPQSRGLGREGHRAVAQAAKRMRSWSR